MQGGGRYATTTIGDLIGAVGEGATRMKGMLGEEKMVREEKVVVRKVGGFRTPTRMVGGTVEEMMDMVEAVASVVVVGAH